jgi:hypothetical protein
MKSRLILLLLAAPASAAFAQYKCTAANGAITFQQTPCFGAKSEQRLNVVPNGHPPAAAASTSASGVKASTAKAPVATAPVASASDSVDKRMLAGYDRQRERAALVQALDAARQDKARRADQRQEAIATARRQYGNDPANASALRDALASIDSRYNALDELGDGRIKSAQEALDRWDKAPPQ